MPRHRHDPADLERLLKTPPRRSRWWIWAGLSVAALVVLGFATALLWVRIVYDGKAARYDLSRIEEMESASLIYDRNQQLLGTIFIQNRDTRPLEKIAPVMQQAAIAAEDARFYRHRGVDYIRVAGAALRNYQAGRITQGGSTITQQLARNSFGLVERSYERKLVEIFLANRIERQYSKSEILELYLNRIYFGGGLYGVEAAARGYFGKAAADLSLDQAAMLAGLIKSPNNLSPWSDRAASIRERNFVLGRMLELGMIDQQEHDAAKAMEPAVKSRRRLQAAAKSYALDFIRQRVIAEVGFENATSEGYRVYTTIDLDLQLKGEQLLRERLSAVEARTGYSHPTYEEYFERYAAAIKQGREDPPPADYLQGALLAIENGTGGILSLVGGRNFEHSEYNRALQARRPAGTAFTPLVYAAGFEKGIFPGALFSDTALDNRQVMIGGVTGILGEWGPERMDNRYEGPIPAREALVKGKNAATVRFGMSTGLEVAIDYARRAGIRSELREYPSTFLGSSEVTLEDMVVAFSVFPNAGWRPEQPYVIQRIDAKDGSLVYRKTPSRIQALDERVAYQVHTMLAESLETGSADKARNKFNLKQMAAGGKTGTAYEFTDVWFLGYQSEITCGIWAGFDKPSTIYRGAFSSDIVLPIWVEFMNAASERYEPRPFRQPTGLRRVEVDLNTGLLATEQSTETYQDPVSGKTMQRRNTYYELSTDEQLPGRYAQGGAPGTPGRDGQWPRAVQAVDLEKIAPIALQAPTVLGEDPYGAVTPEMFAAMSQPASGPGIPPDDSTEVRRAEPVRPIDAAVREGAAGHLLEPPPAIAF